MRLFDIFERTSEEYKRADESHYTFLNETALPKFAATREVLERWFAEYPTDNQVTFAKKFKSKEYGQHFGAFFELYCFTLLRVQDFAVSVEQAVDAHKGNPMDFVASLQQTPAFYVESTVVADSELTVTRERELEYLDVHLNRIVSNRRLFLKAENTSRKQLPYRRIATAVEQWLQALDSADEQPPDSEWDIDERPSYKWSEDGWKLRFEVIPGNRLDDLVFMQGDTDWEGSMSRLKKSLQDKANQHSGVALPYIIAVDVASVETMFRSESSIMEDLFGKEIMLYDTNLDQIVGIKRSPELLHRTDREKGLWLGKGGPRNQHVSGILLVNEVMPWSVMTQTPILWHNPWARHPLSPDFWVGPQIAFDEKTGAIQRREGKTIRQIFSSK